MSDLFYDDGEDAEGGEYTDTPAQESVAVDKGAYPAIIPLFGMQAHEHRFLEMINKNKVPQALIFHGPRGVGKYTMALRLARTLLAHVENPVDLGASLFGDPAPNETKLSVFDILPTHPVAMRVAAGSHPDLLIIGGTEEGAQSKSGNILIDQARRVPGFLRLKPSTENGWRVVIIDNADRLNRNAQNALLKILEEPPARTLLILVTHQLGGLLPTIRSRAQEVRFTALDDADFAAWFKQNGTYTPPEDLAWVRELSKNCPGQAQTMIEIDAVRLIRDFLALWATYPQSDEQAWVDYAERLSSADEGGFAFILSFWQWWVDAMVRAKVDAPYASHLADLIKDAGVSHFIHTHSLQELLAMRDAISPIFDRTLAVSLEKRQALFSARMCMMAA